MTFSTLRALHAVIGAAIDDIERVYHDRSPQGNPMEYPSLDEPYYHTAQHTPEEELSEALKGDPAVAAASKRIVAACGQLATTVNKPWYGLMEDVQRGQFSSAIRFLETANIVEILREAGPGGLHVREIHRLILEMRANLKTAAPADTSPLTPAHISRILRLLATGHYLREMTPDVFANNRASSYIDTGKTVSQLREAPEKKYNDTDGVAAYLALSGDKALKCMSCLTEWALPEEPLIDRTETNFDCYCAPRPELEGQSPTQASAGAIARHGAPFNLAFNTQLGYFPWLELPENEGRFVRFGHGMTGTRQSEIKNQILQGFPWEELPQGSVLVDVGGGIGAQSILVAEAYPHIHVVVEDREQVVSTAVSAWGPQYAHLFESGRMSWGTRDFFEAWPALTLPDIGPVGTPAVFLLRHVLHNWRDEDCKRHVLLRSMLTRLRAAAGPHTKLLIGDMLLPNACADEAAYEGADGSAEKFPFVTKDSPLLPNLGVANLHGYLMDILMMGLFDAKERTVDEMTALAFVAGWKIVEIRRTPGSMWAYTTAVPV
ncbi:S-adenosyl-L-methionine-dependent methyltransferase [Ganoderma leucocontextum]|nr:S-adenosyl-L-methionine-dependent methyltransferase [Ganoderma leucocontextum]